MSKVPTWSILSNHRFQCRQCGHVYVNTQDAIDHASRESSVAVTSKNFDAFIIDLENKAMIRESEKKDIDLAKMLMGVK